MFSSTKNGKLAIFIFIVTLFAFVVESQLTQSVQTTYGYRKPYFLFWIVHSSFVISFPCHLLYLSLNHPLSSLWNGLIFAVSQHLNGRAEQSSSTTRKFPLTKFFGLAFAITAAITVPALLWFAALEMSSVTDVTAIWNTNAFFAYLLSVKAFGLKWEARKLGAVVIATAGVLAVVYGGSTASPHTPSAASLSNSPSTASVPKSSILVGDVLTLIGSVGYAMYQVFYKKRIALPSQSEDYRPLSADPEATSAPLEGSHINSEMVYPPFGLYSNFWAFAIGACTFVVLWIPLPILHWFGIEQFTLPPNLSIAMRIAAIACSGAVFNTGFMILLALWGPIITSVGGLLTIVLVFFSDVLLGATETLTIWGVAGSATIIVAFGVLAYDMLQE
jgi:drug/metabolite transporter (DMT)-like permease